MDYTTSATTSTPLSGTSTSTAPHNKDFDVSTARDGKGSGRCKGVDFVIAVRGLCSAGGSDKITAFHGRYQHPRFNHPATHDPAIGIANHSNPPSVDFAVNIEMQAFAAYPDATPTYPSSLPATHAPEVKRLILSACADGHCRRK